VCDLRELSGDNLQMVATIHLAAFPRSALTRLGVEAVRRYYEWLLVGPHQRTALGAFRDGELVAFLFGGTFSGALTGFLRRNRSYLAVRVATRPWLITTPLFRDRIAMAMRLLRVRRRGRVEASRATPVSPSYGILAIAVAPRWQGTGAGKALMVRAEQIARDTGFACMELSVATWNDQAIEFYLRGGWNKVGTDGWSGVMDKKLL
jgi:ribosomal protein S18 acetylase RimI-like enzyme